MRTVAALLTLVVVALGQECPSSPCGPAAKKAAPGLSARIAKLEKRADQGCKTSAAKLAQLCKAAGATDTKDLKAKVAAFEQYAPCGCDMSRKKLAELSAILDKPSGTPVVSARLPVLLAVAKGGDARAKAILKQVCDECCPPDCCEGECGKGDCDKEACDKEECGAKLIARVQALEAAAAKGCETSAATLAKVATVLASLPTTSTRVAQVLAGAQKGDAKAQAILKGLCDECCPPDCCDDDCAEHCSKDCSDKLVARIRALEASAAKGCATSGAKLARIEARLAGGKAREPADCSGGCKGCPGQPAKQ